LAGIKIIDVKRIFFFLLLGTVACVPLSKFNEEKKRADNLTEENAAYKAELEKLRVSDTEQKSELERLNKDYAKMVTDSMSRYKALKNLQLDYNKQARQLTDLQNMYDNLTKGNAHETTKLLTQLQNAQQDLQKREDELRKSQWTLADEQKKLEVLRNEIDKKNKRMKELEQVLSQKDSAVNALKNAVSDALLGFENNGLTVKKINGKVYVSLDDKLLFTSGSYEVNPSGAKALKKLAKVLEQNNDINVLIEGHTDDVPYRSDASVKDNWDLSAKRATAVVRILLDGSKIDPKRLTAAGRSEFLPVDKGKTAEARQKNRRTEIILTPKLDELLKVLGSN
jgi:chemotaxis protein MotB